jgi:ABC-type transport system involved in Fe-S cluster assembly fused permease/ATPase subunit
VSVIGTNWHDHLDRFLRSKTAQNRARTVLAIAQRQKSTSSSSGTSLIAALEFAHHTLHEGSAAQVLDILLQWGPALRACSPPAAVLAPESDPSAS